MAEYLLKERKLALDDLWDVIVVGGGPAGCAAATAAAREGARTLLLEATSMLGGMGAAGLVPCFCYIIPGPAPFLSWPSRVSSPSRCTAPAHLLPWATCVGCNGHLVRTGTRPTPYQQSRSDSGTASVSYHVQNAPATRLDGVSCYLGDAKRIVLFRWRLNLTQI